MKLVHQNRYKNIQTRDFEKSILQDVNPTPPDQHK